MPPLQTRAKKKFPWKLLFRVGISAALLIIVYSRIDILKLLHTLRPVSWQAGLILMFTYAAGQALSSQKWRIFLAETNVHRGAREALNAYFFGMFVNTFGLGTIGGDVARALAIKPGKGQRAGALATVVADRLHGLMTLVGVAAVAIIFVRPPMLGSLAVPFSALVVLGLFVAYWYGPRILTFIFPKHHKFGDAALLATRAFPRRPVPFFSVTALSIVFHLSQIGMHVYLCSVLGIDLSIGYLLATVPLINAISTLPISVSGLGVREALYVFFFAPMGVSNELAIALGAVWIVVATIVSALGALLLPTLQSSLDEAEQQAEEFEEEAIIEKQKALG